MNDSDCSDPELGKFLRALLSGLSPPFTEGRNVKWAKTHVRTCPACREHFPNAEEKLEHILLRSILDGSEPVDPWDLDRVDSHARRCEECRLEHPDVLGELAKIR